MASQQSPDRGERAPEAAAKSSVAVMPPPPAKSEAPAKVERMESLAKAEKPEVVAKPEVGVERLTHQDVNEVCALYKRVWDAQKGDLPAEMIKAWEPTPLEFTSWMEGVTYFVARKGGKVVGIVGLEIRHSSGRIVHLAVDPEDRRKGVATALVRAAIDWSRHSGCSSVWADALARFTAAADVLRHLGFQESGVLHRHEWSEDVRFFEELL